MVWPCLKPWGHSQLLPKLLDKRVFTSGLPSSFRLPLPYLRPVVSLHMPFSSHDNPSLALLPVVFLKTKSDHILLLPKTIQCFILSTTSFSWYQIPSQSDYNPHSSQWCLNTHTTLATYSLDSHWYLNASGPFVTSFCSHYLEFSPQLLQLEKSY